ncbi:MAG TPA: hypothetical protein VMF69_19035 [Gemmataceae bacterium]|nr:hypothetical protein [Gemmataceae bacterium]
MQPQPSHPSADLEPSTNNARYLFPGVELRLTSPLNSCDPVYPATGIVRLEAANAALVGCSVRIRSLNTGLAEEAFLDERGAFAQEMELQPETDNALEFAVCDGVGREMARVVVVVRHQIRAGSASDGGNLSLALPARQARHPMLDPPWPRFAQLVQRCLSLAAEVADKTGHDPDELYDPIRAQERYAEQAFEERNQTLYQECNDNLEEYGGYLKQLLGDTLPRPPRPGRPPEEEARFEIERFRVYLSSVWKQAREKQRADLEVRLSEIAAQARGWSQRAKSDPLSVLREANRLGAEVEKVADQLPNNR